MPLPPPVPASAAAPLWRTPAIIQGVEPLPIGRSGLSTRGASLTAPPGCSCWLPQTTQPRQLLSGKQLAGPPSGATGAACFSPVNALRKNARPISKAVWCMYAVYAGASAVRSSVPASQAQRGSHRLCADSASPHLRAALPRPSRRLPRLDPLEQSTAGMAPSPSCCRLPCGVQQARGLNVTVSFLSPRLAQHFACRAIPLSSQQTSRRGA